MPFIILLIFILPFLPAHTQTIFSLPQSVDYCLKNHPSQQVYANNLRIAKEKSKQNLAGYLPQVNSSMVFIDNLALQTTLLPAGIIGPSAKEVQFGTQFNTTAGFDATQTIFDKSKLAALKSNAPYREAAALQQKLNEETIVYNTAVAYFQALIYEEQLKIFKANKKKYEEMVTILDYQYKKGVVLEKEADRVRVNLNTTNYQLEDAVSKEILSLNNLKNAMGMPLESVIKIIDSFNYELLADKITNDSLLPALLLEAKLNIKARQAVFYPTLTAVGKWATQAMSNNFSEAFARWSSYSYMGLSLNFPLCNGFKRKSQLAEEKLKLSNEIAGNTINTESLKLRFQNAKTSAGSAYTSYKSARDNLALAKKILEVTDYQYQRGVAGLTDYLNDDAACKSAQSNYISSLYNLMIGQLNYHKSKGTLLSFLNQIK
jgi:outer membrane protein